MQKQFQVFAAPNPKRATDYRNARGPQPNGPVFGSRPEAQAFAAEMRKAPRFASGVVEVRKVKE